MTSPPVIGPNWPGARTLVTDTRAPSLDLSAAVGQQQATFRFALTNGITGQHLGNVTPIRTARLSHDTSSTTKRRLQLSLGRADTAAVNPVSDRIAVYMSLPVLGEFPLGRYMWLDNPRRVTTGGRLAQPVLVDEMFLVDQPILVGLSGAGRGVLPTIFDAIEGLPVTLKAEATPYFSVDSWGLGTTRGQVLQALATAGDYWSPWFDNTGNLRFVRTFNPADRPADIDLDAGYRVIRNSISETDDLLTSPNTVIVTSNSASDPSVPVVGIASVPATAPNSVANRGFVIAQTYSLQLSDNTQAAAVASGLIRRLGIAETVTLSTPADPRHDSYNVIHWQGANWLELSWSMDLIEGAAMTHTMRKGYL